MPRFTLRLGFLVAALSVAGLAAWILVFVLSRQGFWSELNLFLAVFSGIWFLALWLFLFFGWGIRGESLLSDWRPKLQDPSALLEFLGHLPRVDFDLGGDDLVGALVALVGSFLAAVALVLVLLALWGFIELAAFVLVAALFFLVHWGFRAQVVRNRRARGKPLRSLWLSAYLTMVSIGWVPVVLWGVRTWLR